MLLKRAASALAAVGIAGVILARAVLVLASPAAAAAQTTLLNYTFSTSGTLVEAGSTSLSTSPYLWVNAGAKLDITGGVGQTIQGSLSSSDPWRAIYATKLPGPTDNGAHPQNVFRMFARNLVQNVSAQVYVNRVADNLSNSANRHEYNGESLIARYKDANNYYYAGIRADGNVVIKKKTNGIYQTLATKKVLAGTYSASTNPDLMPLNKWVGLKLDVNDTSSGPKIVFSTDIGKTGTWVQQLSVTDDPTKYGAAVSGAGLVGVQNDYADAKFGTLTVIDTSDSATTPPPPTTPPPTSTGYDAAVMGDSPVMYLGMGSASTGVESDKTGNGHNGSYKGGTPTTVSLPNGDKAADFNGSSQYLTVPSSAALSIPTTHQLTWEAWIRPDTFSFSNASGDGYIDWMGKCQDYSPTCEWEARIYGDVTPEGRPDRLSAYVFNPSAGLGSAADWQPAAKLTAGKWIHVVAEYQTQTTPSLCSSSYPGTINIWVNGVKQNFEAHADTGCMSQYNIKPTAGSSPLNIGTMAMDTWFKGAVGKVAVYNHLLTQTQINAHYTAMTGAAVTGSCGATCSF